ncbi:MAG: tRNA (N6-threonylcarbamoyladenosine(37)-N6)-methyltransferase TrmO [Desulfobacterales bacterium]|nr:tRNA (N6-threonylcarbamoyladenosine(37)-N6)-methyltransferase TrmO [Desulfobacterales bacterium]
MPETFQIFPVGRIHKKEAAIWIDIFAPYADALLGLEGFSHILVLFWFHENDTANQRKTLRVHPRKDSKNPLTGVFGTHSPLRPNLIGLTRCKINSIAGQRIYIEDIDAFDGTPVIDIKCFIPDSAPESEIRLPDWV